MNAFHLSKVLALSFCVIITGCASSKGSRTLAETESSTQAIESKEVDNIQIYENIQSTFTDCEGNPKAAWVLISPRAFPESLSGKFALLKFQVDDETKPYDVNLVEGDTEIADWSKNNK